MYRGSRAGSEVWSHQIVTNDAGAGSGAALIVQLRDCQI